MWNIDLVKHVYPIQGRILVEGAGVRTLRPPSSEMTCIYIGILQKTVVYWC